MSYYKNIVPGQFQLGDVVFGRGTTIIVDNFDVKPYDLNVQDFQRVRSDEINFGQDFKKPTTMELSLNVLYNELLPEFKHLDYNFWRDMPTVDDLAREWSFDEGRKLYGQMKPLYVCGRDRIPKIVFGRPGQFSHQDPTGRGEVVPALAEFRRADTLGYGVTEYGKLFTQNTLTGVINGTQGTLPSWIRILIRGPINTPTVVFSKLFGTPAPYTLHLDYNVAGGEVVEISSYPWERRAVSSTGENLSSYLDSDTPYLDRLLLLHNEPTTITVSGNNKTANTQVALLYRDAYRTL